MQFGKKPQKGNIQIYKLEDQTNTLSIGKEQLIKEKLEYNGAEKSDLQNLEIANQGGMILLRYVNENLGTYKSNEEEIRHDGTLLGKIEITDEDLFFTASFDISIELVSGKKYKSSIELEMPSGKLVEQGTTNFEKSSDIIFKRY